MIYLACTLACVRLALHVRWAYVRDQWTRRQIRMLKENVARLQVAEQNRRSVRIMNCGTHSEFDVAKAADALQEALKNELLRP